MENDNALSAQVPDATASQPNEQGAEGGQEQSGFEKRIGELTAARHQAEATAQRFQEMVLKQGEQITQLLASRVQAPQQADIIPETPEGLDPAAAAYFQRLVDKMEAKLAGSIAGVQAYTQRGEAAQHAVALASKLGIADASWIQERAAVLAEAGKKNGLPLVAKDYARFALSEYLEEQPQQRATNGRFMPSAASASGQGYSPPPPQAQSRKALPSNFDSLSPTQQLNAMAQTGRDDLPL